MIISILLLLLAAVYTLPMANLATALKIRLDGFGMNLQK